MENKPLRVAIEQPEKPADELSKMLDQAVWRKVEELESKGDPEGVYRWQGMELQGDTDGKQLKSFRHAVFTQIAKAIGFEHFMAMPAPLLEQVAIMSCAKEHRIGALLESLLLKALTAYAHPQTSSDAFKNLTQIHAMSGYAMQDYAPGEDGRCPGCGEIHDDDDSDANEIPDAPPSDVTLH
jgi:hypothetical protein